MPYLSRIPGNREKALREFFHRRRVLVVGADGFLGYNCALMLRDLGAELSVLTRRTASRAADIASHTFVADLRDSDKIELAVHGQAVVFDFAGGPGPVASNQSPSKSLDEDGRAQLNLFRACAEANSRVIFCSSRLVYGKPDYLPVDEKSQLRPQSMYAAHKILAEYYLSALSKSRGLRYSILRLSNPYGPHQYVDQQSSGVINQLIRRACAGEAIRVYGDGSQKRDYIFVADAILAFLLCAMNEGCDGQTFNLGGLRPVPFVAVAELISRLAGGPPVQFEPWPASYKAVETGDYVTDLAKIERFINLPEMLSIEEGIRKSIDFYKSLP
jgi:nucleoside-diphosphate-sugar epimerase